MSMYLEFAFLQGCHVHSERLRHAMRPMTHKELEARQLAQAAGMRNVTDEELASLYGDGLRNAYSPPLNSAEHP
jgi:hypothetical protein